MNYDIKKELNNNKPIWKELEIFRELARIISKNGIPAAFVSELHQHCVQFWSSFQNQTLKREPADLLFVIHDNTRSSIRILFLQAKQFRNLFPKFIKCKADFFQWELLCSREKLIGSYIGGNSTYCRYWQHLYLSMTSFGIFYKDQIGDIDMFFTIPEFLYPLSFPKTTKHSERVFQILTPCASKIYTSQETLMTCTLNTFFMDLMALKIGHPLPLFHYRFVNKLASKLRFLLSKREVQSDIIRPILINIEENFSINDITTEKDDFSFPNLFLISIPNKRD